MRLIIQIPCFNEEATLPETLKALPRAIPGFNKVEWLVVNDGSTDNTLEVARQHGVDHIVDLAHNQGLAHAFVVGIERALEEDADIIVNTDADNQYDARDIANLVAPILDRRAELVVGARPITTIEHFSPVKKILQRVGSWVVRFTSNTDVQDATSGFRAISRQAALRLNIFDGYTYTLESIIQAGRLGIPVVSVPISVNPATRPSRLIKSLPGYLMKSVISILRSLLVYRPGRVFFALGAVPLAAGFLLTTRWLFLYLAVGTERSHVPSLIAAAVMLILGALFWLCALLGELMGINRRLLEDTQYQLRCDRLGTHPDRNRAEKRSAA
jgi:glycosyltransferase involved in cell wall biosynthesis